MVSVGFASWPSSRTNTILTALRIPSNFFKRRATPPSFHCDSGRRIYGARSYNLTRSPPRIFSETSWAGSSLGMRALLEFRTIPEFRENGNQVQGTLTRQPRLAAPDG